MEYTPTVMECVNDLSDEFLLEKRVRFGGLFDAYCSLLSERQRLACEMLLDGDLTVAELGDALGVTRQGAHDLLRRSRDRLEEIEANLHLLDLKERFFALLDAVDSARASLPGDFIDGLDKAGFFHVDKGEF